LPLPSCTDYVLQGVFFAAARAVKFSILMSELPVIPGKVAMPPFVLLETSAAVYGIEFPAFWVPVSWVL